MSSRVESQRTADRKQPAQHFDGIHVEAMFADTNRRLGVGERSRTPKGPGFP